MQPVDLFYSYAHEDEELRNELAGHLKIMERRGVIRSWHDRDIMPGQAWDTAIDRALTTADLVLLLISSDFINSDYIWSVELETALRRHAKGETTVIPVLIRACDFEDAPFANVQGLPTDLRPVTSWANRDEAWTDVAKGIRRAAMAIREKSARTGAAPAIPTPILGGERGRQDVIDNSAGIAVGPGVSGNEPTAMPGQPKAPAPHPSGPVESAVDAADSVLSQLIESSAQQVAAAVRARGMEVADPETARRISLELVDVPEQKRILWVDDRPQGNSREIAVLARLQIQIATAINTAEALHCIEQDPEPFDLIISDWTRDEEHPGAPSAAVALLRALRKRGYGIPVVLYHGTFDETRRRLLAQIALGAGAVGETTRPDELFAMIASIFMRSGTST